MIDVNAIELDAENASNGWITLDKTDEEGNRIKIYIEGAVGQTQEEKRRKKKSRKKNTISLKKTWKKKQKKNLQQSFALQSSPLSKYFL